MRSCFRSNGKFLLTGEYLVLKGAVALALPLKLGQSMEVETSDDNEGLIYWDAFLKTTRQQDNETTSKQDTEKWFSVTINKNDFSIKKSDDWEKAERLSNILSKAKSLNADLFNDSHDYRFTTLLDFNTQWGLGSSSTLINNVAEWAHVNPYQLLDMTFKGSGYDIACAKAKAPIFYKTTSQRVNETSSMSTGCAVTKNIESKQVQRSEVAGFNPDFKDNLYFVYLGHKQNSSKEVKAFLDKDRDYTEEIKAVSEISRLLAKNEKFDDFCHLISAHEDIIASCIGRPSVRNDFQGFEGTLKSLGAWGGDFILAATKHDDDYVRKYFESKSLDVIIKYKDIVLG